VDAIEWSVEESRLMEQPERRRPDKEDAWNPADCVAAAERRMMK